MPRLIPTPRCLPLLAGTLVLLPAFLPVSASAQKRQESSSLTAPMTASQIDQKYRDTVVSIITDKGTGIGFFVNEGKFVVTCYHVLCNTTRITLKDNKGNAIPIQKISVDPDFDSAVLWVGATSPYPAFRFDPMKFDSVAPGDPIFVIGNLLGRNHSATTGVLGAIRQQSGVTLFQITASLRPGSSGGPVITAQGDVIGFVKATRTEGQAVSSHLTSQVAQRGWQTLDAFYADNGVLQVNLDEYYKKQAKKEASECTKLIARNPVPGGGGQAADARACTARCVGG